MTTTLPPPPVTLRPEWDEIKLQLWSFGDRQPTPIPESTASPKKLRRLAFRIIRKAERIKRKGWWTAPGDDGRRRHVRWDDDIAIHFAMCQLTNLHPSRQPANDVYRFTFFGLGGDRPHGEALTDWVCAYRLVIRALQGNP